MAPGIGGGYYFYMLFFASVALLVSIYFIVNFFGLLTYLIKRIDRNGPFVSNEFKKTKKYYLVASCCSLIIALVLWFLSYKFLYY